MRAVVVRRLQALEVEVQVAHRRLRGNALRIDGKSKFRSRTGGSAATRFGSMGIGRKGRSCACPHSRGVTSKSPMHSGAASSLGMYARLARRTRQRQRVYQFGKGSATNRGGPGGRQAPRWPVCSAKDLPRPAPRQRPGPAYEVSIAGRSAVLRRRIFGPALLREAPRCSCPAVACGDRGVSNSTWAGGLLFGADGVAATVSPDRTAGMPPWPPQLPQAPRQSRLRCRTPSLSPRASRTFRTSREAAACRVWMSISPAIGRMAHRARFAPAARRSSGMAHPCPRGCISRRKSAMLAYRGTAIRHLGVGIHELWLPRPHRISTGCLVSQSVGMAPDHAATGRLPHGRYDSAITKAAPEKSS